MYVGHRHNKNYVCVFWIVMFPTYYNVSSSMSAESLLSTHVPCVHMVDGWVSEIKCIFSYTVTRYL